MSLQEATRWLTEFEQYFKERELDLQRQGYQSDVHQHMVLNAYLDLELESRLNEDEPMADW